MGAYCSVPHDRPFDASNRAIPTSPYHLQTREYRPFTFTAGNVVGTTRNSAGTCELTRQPAGVHKVTIAIRDTNGRLEVPAEFFYKDPLASISLSKADDVHLFPEFKRRLYSALSDGDEGELSIALPEEMTQRIQNVGLIYRKPIDRLTNGLPTGPPPPDCS